jgi:glucose 1-dehydrogenase
MLLKGKVAIVTGGNSGIGKAIVLELAEQGANVAIDYVSHPDATEDLERRIVALGGSRHRRRRRRQQGRRPSAARRRHREAFGRLDIMVNNAGIESRTSVLDTTEKQYDAVLQVNLKSAFFGTQLAAKQMIRQGGGGHIINITSVHEDWPMPGNIAYCLSKGGMRMLTAHGRRRTGASQNPRRRRRSRSRSPRRSIEPRWTTPPRWRSWTRRFPLGRMAQPEEIASVVAMLASDRASYITATTCSPMAA